METKCFANNIKSEGFKTEETYITNSEFLSALFGELEQECQSILVSYLGDPKSVDRRVWKGTDRKRGINNQYLSNNNNNYFTPATFKSDKHGYYSRKKKDFNSLHAIMLDDIGTKVAAESITLEPTSYIETSPSNYQAIYFLSEEIKDAEQAELLVNAVIAAGLSDPGADGPTARLARLPCGVNGKHNPEFVCRMQLWNPQNRYTMQELITGLKLDPFISQLNVASATKKTPKPRECIYDAAENENIVLSALKNDGLYKTPLGDGKHDITCPWVEEHSEPKDTGAAYFEPDNNYVLGGFNCFHGHCKHRNIKDLLGKLDIPLGTARNRATITVVPGELGSIIDASEQALAKAKKYYQRGGLIVRVFTDPGLNVTSISELKSSNIRVALSNEIYWEKYDTQTQSYKRIDPPVQYSNGLYDMGVYNHLPILKHLSRQPYLRPDGTLSTLPGYDPVTYTFGVFSAADFHVEENPTKEQAQAAINKLEKLLEEFCFKEETDKSAALCAILTGTIRSSLPTAPMFHVRAPQIGSGKSYLCQIFTGFCTPQVGSPTTFPQEDEECRKLLLAELLSGPAVIEFDNLTEDLLPHKSLCAALTSEHISGRILGVSKTATVSTRALFLSSGNNVGPIKDMARRCITINLDPACEVPAGRKYSKPNLLPDFLSARGEYISAALTIIRAWIIAGRPRHECKSLTSFNDWVDLCCQSLMWLGYADPMKSAFDAMNNDPERKEIAQLMVFWDNIFGKASGMVRELVEESYKNIELKEILENIAADKKGGINRRRLGKWIKRNANRVVTGRRFVKADGTRSAEAWKLETVP